jgi:hypothetical protein
VGSTGLKRCEGAREENQLIENPGMIPNARCVTDSTKPVSPDISVLVSVQGMSRTFC